MFDIGWSEMAVVALIALLVIGPKELPRAMRTAAKWVRKARAVTREFQSGVDDMIRESELEEARKALSSANPSNIDQTISEAIDPTGSVKQSLDELERDAKSDETTETPRTKPLPGGGLRKEAEDAAEPAPDTDELPAADQQGEARPAGEARVIHNPAPMAPPHSVTPPAEPAPATEPQDGDDETPAPDGRRAGQGA